MTRPRSAYALGASFTALSLVTLVDHARAATQPTCTSLPNPLVIEAGDTQEPLIKSLGQKLANSTANQMTIVYNLTGSCTIVGDLYASPRNKLKINLSYIPTATDPYAPGWTPSMASPQCIIDPAGQDIDLGISALFIESCGKGAPVAPLGQIKGPIQGYTFVVPTASSQTSIHAEEAYFVFGFGQSGGVAPWTDETQMFIRTTTKSTLLSIAANIHVPAAKWKGVPLDKSAMVVSSVSQSTKPEATIGILGMEVYDQNRSTLKVLAYEAFGQYHAYYPDSTASSFDKRNVRDGHYTMWSPTVYMSDVDGTGELTKPNAKLFKDLVLGNTTLADANGLDAVISKGLVPDCAMKVSRTADGGDLALYTPAAPCGCYFESKVPQGSTTCTACVDNTPCGTGTCRHGFCEAK